MPNKIKACVIARGSIPICEYDATDVVQDDGFGQQDLVEVCHRAVDKIPRGTNSSQQFLYLGQTFNYLFSGDILFLCIAETEAGTEAVFTFLRDVKYRYERMQGQDTMSITRMLRDVTVAFNESHSNSKIEKMQKELHEVTDIMKANIDSVLSRGEQIGNLVDKSSTLSSGADRFKRQAQAANRAWWLQEMQTKAIIIVIVFVVFYVCCCMG